VKSALKYLSAFAHIARSVRVIHALIKRFNTGSVLSNVSRRASTLELVSFSAVCDDFFAVFRKSYVKLSSEDSFFSSRKVFLEHRGKDEVGQLVGAKTHGATPLVMACRNGHYDVAEYLIEKCGADVEQPGSGQTVILSSTASVLVNDSFIRNSLQIRNDAWQRSFSAAVSFYFESSSIFS